jgi:hypothetical protein
MALEALPPKLRDALARLVAACRETFGDALRCVIVKGSALKGDFLFGYSDLDIHAFVDPEALVGDRTPTLDHALRFQEAIGGMTPRDAGASQFQVYFLRADRPPEDWTPAVPGSYAVVYGEPPPALTNWRDADFVGQAARNLAGIPGEVLMLTGRILDKPDTSLAAYVRLAGTFVKGRAYSAAIRASGDPERALGMRTTELLRYLESRDPSLAAVRRFFDFAASWERVERDPPYAREAFRAAIAALETLATWANSLEVGSAYRDRV